jgi:CheY-like chemotaxis protein
VTGQLRIIVLDTSPTTRKILEVILHREGHQVACFDDSLEALRALSRHGPADLLFLGLDLSKMDGFEVLKYLRGEPRFHPIGIVALLGERDGILVRLKARLAGSDEAADAAADRRPGVRIPLPEDSSPRIKPASREYRP